MNIKSAETLEKVVNDRLRLMYSKRFFSNSSQPVINENNDQLQAESSSLLAPAKKLSADEKDRLLCELINNSEKLSSSLEEFSTVCKKLHTALNQLLPLQKLCCGRLSSETSSAEKLQALAETFPFLLSMYEQEMNAKKAVLADLRHFESRDVFMAILASWKHEAFVDKNVLSVIYSLVV